MGELLERQGRDAKSNQRDSNATREISFQRDAT